MGRFNQALLGKQAWRIWSRPESLVARVLQGRYFARSSFLDCGTGTRPSFAWRNIIHGWELLKKDLSKEDSIRWSFTKDGTYSTRSGYQFTDALLEFQSQHNQALPPIEKKLWSNIWKIKAPPKIKHFIWRSLAGALAVKERLQTRGIPIDATCLGCGAASESICHVLFHCDKSRQTWELSNVPLPPAGFSRNSVFLNMLHLISVMNNNRLEQKILPPRQIVTLAFDEAEIWIAANSLQAETEQVSSAKAWSKPPVGAFKCNLGTSWINAQSKCGVSWILRDSQGNIISHSRRSYSAVRSKHEASLRALFWAVESMKNMRQNNIIFEVLLFPRPSPNLNWIVAQINALLEHIEFWRLDHVVEERNEAANLIAKSVTTRRKYHSYIASQDPAWLQSLLILEGQSQ
ncbi:PREDICTED: uncharacterized protein LOC106330165 [Brassica oleracea var. oleracea]|uniref:uncharacterized protein LOC106330165 n=1 Tax=Brassica oleracea var. oleracea TaxID=109376 RepID=UPI0006A6A308|nr:PREDICTED: uncharacterized protein LOC106330165 [Brassica oleracea var. oleracea]